jgi:hypothetical protein
MEPAEELFNIERDPLELKNLAADPEHATALEDMRRKYDKELAAWKRQAVPYNDYRRYGTLFDRNAAWNTKQPLCTTPKR